MVKKLGQKLLTFVIGSLLAEGVIEGVKNISAGKTFFGKEKIKKENKMDWKGNVHLGTNEYEVT